MKKARHPKSTYFIEEMVSRVVTKKEFLERQMKEMEKSYIQQVSLLDRKIFTRSQIDKLVSTKILSPQKYKSKIYFKKDDVVVGIKYISEPPHLF
jgi:hypothetical protein